ncbi:NYN domain-containing protein [Leptolyngbya sp. AN02str]|uniref:NYN domain-containing protein n=1 Tax=Leptolyngbya sp. AN02str TaxID=3423363 RepID=UPI003D31BCF9
MTPSINNVTVKNFRIAIYWDWQNIKVKFEEQLQKLEQFVSSKGSIVSRVIFAHWSKEPEKWESLFDDLNYECINAIASRKKRNNADRKLISHIRRYALNDPKIHTVVLISGDGDFRQIVRELKAKNKRVILVVHDKKQANDELIKLVDECQFLSAL